MDPLSFAKTWGYSMVEMGKVSSAVLESRLRREKCVVILANGAASLATVVMREGRESTSDVFDSDDGAVYAALTGAITLAHDLDEDLADRIAALRDEVFDDEGDGE